MRKPTATVAETIWRQGRVTDGKRIIPEETAVAFSYDGGTYAVMMATPQDLEDFALGFSLTEGVVSSPADVRQSEIVEHGAGIELRMWLAEPHSVALGKRRRHLAGPTGCGLCGIESLEEAARPVSRVRHDASFTATDIMDALAALMPRQELNRQTRAVHAAAFWRPEPGLVAVREDVGRHNALDKLAGALARSGTSTADGMVLLTSRVSVEMVQKTAAIGAPLIVAVSAPTALALRTAEAAGITLVGIARDDGFEVFTHPQRIKEMTKEAVSHVVA
ncbi:MAG TPA: formate dehydrogenase accessory sulfurtransferase FdhD [Xanthobacteraceae bacterium]|jgi:FdhD protein